MPNQTNRIQRSILLLGIAVCLIYIGISFSKEESAVAALSAANSQLFLATNVKSTGPEYKIIYESEGDLYMMNMQGNNKVNITNSPSITESRPLWSPDGTQIAYLAYTVEDENEAFVMNVDGSDSINISQGLVDNYLAPAWSPDSSKLLFVSERTGKGDIYVVNRDGTNLTNLTNSPDSDESHPAWSPDGLKIAFSHGNTYYLRIKVMDANGANVITLADALGGNLRPAWSPDGSQIAFSSGRDSDDYDLFLMNADGSNQRNMTSGINTYYLLGPFLWSPDSAYISFAVETRVYPTGNSDIYRVHVLDSTIENLTPSQVDDEFLGPQWTPDGTRMFFYSEEWNGPNDIFVMDANGSNMQNITNSAYVSERSPVVSPIPIGQWQLFLPMVVGK